MSGFNLASFNWNWRVTLGKNVAKFLDVHFQNARNNEWIIEGKNESRPMFGLTWYNPEQLVTAMHYVYIDKLIEKGCSDIVFRFFLSFIFSFLFFFLIGTSQYVVNRFFIKPHTYVTYHTNLHATPVAEQFCAQSWQTGGAGFNSRSHLSAYSRSEFPVDFSKICINTG